MTTTAETVTTETIAVDVQGNVGIVEIRRGPHNFFDENSLKELADALVNLDTDPSVRVVVLCAEGKSFCAGADLRGVDQHMLRRVYRAASQLFTTRKPIIAAIQGAAVGGGLGLAMAADFRVAGPRARLTANFARLGFHHGFGLSVTLPAAIGQQYALDLLYSGRNVDAAEALALGLVDRITDDDPRTTALDWATDIARSAPLSLTAIRSTLRRDLASRVVAALDEEATAQTALLHSADFAEGVAASIGKRPPEFSGS
ncbi:enoyl-CoA hydratase/isomerase family protein [Rhodococcus erythropolis]|uniref:Enoyl-CoA hydratase/isomerase family protein n=2 Tax=Rhodococcus erythropolis TaxID=1833 RepID=A0A401N0I8_RHOER|nr:enoyl-CoA hydratase/isomerase family protein [Rhodococcus erythropolis]MBH5143770.1 enoyl-CoA hydratase/isomerase family protein [Rhodococcus erythropolis]MBO8146417.1 enoyl-CoA hydratase/isomerase family protein [Rhodococcus erythropolis]MCQ4124835.1 enoyl-CoA hydratase/isomerase family protein [Rhodococcus erythropolis]MDO1489456.1 enoyl-CoA hydratase/isomerase family protein [Rhodococcus erythropolis]BAH31550.1 putative enoyl-CoA hydratase [Rhodococcus erythropolis PR4]